MPINFFPFPSEILKYRDKLKNPRQGRTRGKKTEPVMLPFTPTYKIIFAAICSLLNPLLQRSPANLEFSYQDIQNECAVPRGTIKTAMPTLVFNFPQFFEITDKQFSKGYTYKFNYTFVQEFKASGGISFSAKRTEQFVQRLSATDLAKWNLFTEVSLQYEQKRLQIFSAFQNSNFGFWERNVRWAFASLRKKPEWQGKVPNKWIWKCLEHDYGYNKLDKDARSEALGSTNGYSKLKEQGIDLDKVLTQN